MALMPEENPITPPPNPLKFKVAPHIVQDLGLNLYTTLPRVLVEFVANAYDADSPDAQVSLDLSKIEQARRVLKKEWELEQEKSEGARDKKDARNDLSQRTLPADIQIVITDHGHGMSRDDLQTKFLIAGRRRREAEDKVRSDEGRILMGRKGLGKLAGFGVARTVTIISRKQGEQHATKITLDYDELIKVHIFDEVEIQEELLADGADIDPHGTKVILSRLAYEPTKSREETIGNDIADHFAMIDPAEFAIRLNDNPVMPTPRNLVFAYPSPEIPLDQTVKHSYVTDDGVSVEYQYRIRFTGLNEHLNARERGVRIYAHKRLAATSDLLDMTTGIHGFNNTHYLDGIVHADFIDENRAVDYIATDRQTLRWDSSLLAPMREHLSSEMAEACREYQKQRETKAKHQVRNDPFTKNLVEAAKLPKHRKSLAYKVAAAMAAVSDKGVENEDYKKQMPIFVDGLVQGNILNALADLASKDHPDFNRLVGQVMELTHQELGDFLRVIQGRLDGIEALKKLVEDVDFKKSKNEDKLHELFENAPWLIDPTFTQFLTSDQAENELNRQLTKELGIGTYVPANYSPAAPDEIKELGANKRPDLVFLLSNTGLMRLIIVELKAPNTPLHMDHLDQLKGYIRRAEKWLKANGKDIKRYRVEGILIGSHAAPDSKAEKVEALRDDMEKVMETQPWTVFGINEVLDRTMRAHRELLTIYERAVLAEEEDEESDAMKTVHNAA
jgi:hypothetical protein